MTFHYNGQADFALAATLDEIETMGVRISSGTDFEVYREFLAETRPDHALGEPFEPAKYGLTAQNALWIVGRDMDGRIVHTQALKRMRLGGGSLGDYLHKNLREFEPSGVSIDYGRSVYRAGPAANRMTGTIVYHGEFWVGGSPRRGALLSPVLGKFAFLTALKLWRPDYTFGFIAKSLAHKGFASRFGFMHSEPNAICYAMTGSDETFEGIMGYMTSEDLAYVVDTPGLTAMPHAA
ncbi:MAG: hypothetical protein AAGF36_08765 [Pseudomonadota bacterium]